MSDTKPSTPTYRAISSLHNWEHNPRTATKDGIERLIKQIKKLGVYKPLLITEDGTVLGGNMRLKALEQIGQKDVWVSVVNAPTEELKIEYALSDNDRVGKYEGDQLANLIGNFPEVEWGDYAVDIKEPELVSDLMDSFKEVEEDEAPAVETGPAESKLGEVYTLGRHRVMCGDSTKIEDVEKLMNGQKADFFMGDPPYGMRLDTNYSGMHGMHRGKNHKEVIGDSEDFDVNKIMFAIQDIDKQIWFGADYYSSSLKDTEHLGSWGVWDKRVEESQDKGFGSCFELFWSKEKHKRMIYRYQWAGFFTQGEKRDFDHPTEKSVRLLCKILEDYGKDTKNIIDLFLGSGSTLIACEQTNRICYGMELDPHYVDVIRKRYNNFVNNRKITGK